MFLKKMLREATLFLAFGSLSATASSIRDWDDGSRNRLEEAPSASRSLGEEVLPGPEDNFPSDVIEVVTTKRQNGVKLPRKSLSMVQYSSKRGADIKDETAITGENANRRLPPSVKHQPQGMVSSSVHEIHQVLTPLFLTGSDQK